MEKTKQTGRQKDHLNQKGWISRQTDIMSDKQTNIQE